MENRKMISVAMITKDGEKYLEDQIRSVLENLSAGDELVVSDDGSTDHTLEILQDFRNHDPRIRLETGRERGS